MNEFDSRIELEKLVRRIEALEERETKMLAAMHDLSGVVERIMARMGL